MFLSSKQVCLAEKWTLLWKPKCLALKYCCKSDFAPGNSQPSRQAVWLKMLDAPHLYRTCCGEESFAKSNLCLCLKVTLAIWLFAPAQEQQGLQTSCSLNARLCCWQMATLFGVELHCFHSEVECGDANSPATTATCFPRRKRWWLTLHGNGGTCRCYACTVAPSKFTILLF